MSDRSGRIFYVVGPSGAGKDTVLSIARRQCPHELDVVFAHRYITRAADTGGENHIALTELEFNKRLNAGCFSMSWCANNCSYAVGVEVDAWRERGLDVVVNGSREQVARMRSVFSRVFVINITAPAHTLESRLRSRGREAPEEVASRLSRAALLALRAGDADLDIVNIGRPEEAANQLLRAISSH